MNKQKEGGREEGREGGRREEWLTSVQSRTKARVVLMMPEKTSQGTL